MLAAGQGVIPLSLQGYAHSLKHTPATEAVGPCKIICIESIQLASLIIIW